MFPRSVPRFLSYLYHMFVIYGIYFCVIQKKIQTKQLLELLESLAAVKKEVKEILDILGLLSPSSSAEVIHLFCIFIPVYSV